ncbi:NAD(P)/FAD-dependent oxidoreductase [Alkaliphilus serpentinus]|uniref:NAD(P)/FAD-dependent oxidoreductase n=2 Tax=Alkaliphilus serpentinus TaxID=1482731 RepID=A0A833M7J4_9FIRM|nr:NAD(P)/FAD-dependent oxidoreductase [Alkaliphilus serpentinus]
MKDENRVLIIGGGAAGLTAAIAAARNKAEVMILEASDRVGRKILATGNGRCNLTNVNMDIKRFHGENVKFAKGPLKQFDVDQVINLFEFLGISCKVEDGGKVYPYSDQASSVLDVLRYQLQALGVEERCNSKVKGIKPSKGGFKVILEDDTTIHGNKVIVATGGMASPQLGSDGSGYNLLKALGHSIIEPFPALIQLKLEAKFLKGISGVKFVGEASIEIDDKALRIEGGEILFTDYGISGPPILQLSRLASEGLMTGKIPYITLDLFPQLTKEELYANLKLRLAYQPERPLDFSFIGLINKKLIPVVLKEANLSSPTKPSVQVKDQEIRRLVELLKGWRLKVNGTQAWKHAQVTAGGIKVDEVDPRTMESRLIQGLYIAGEILDIDGDCGGFNLQWAWSTGYIAGEAAILNHT